MLYNLDMPKLFGTFPPEIYVLQIKFCIWWHFSNLGWWWPWRAFAIQWWHWFNKCLSVGISWVSSTYFTPRILFMTQMNSWNMPHLIVFQPSTPAADAEFWLRNSTESSSFIWSLHRAHCLWSRWAWHCGLPVVHRSGSASVDSNTTGNVCTCERYGLMRPTSTDSILKF